MNSSAKNLLLEKARSLLLDAVGCMSCPIAPQLSEKLEKAGPVPFAPAEIEKRLAPEEILADTKSIAVILFPYRYTEENYRILLFHISDNFCKIITTLSARILQKLSDIWKSSIPMKNSMRLPIHPPWQTAGSLIRQDSVFSAGTTASYIRSTVLTLPSEPY